MNIVASQSDRSLDRSPEKSIKTIEFKFTPNQAQESRLNHWLSSMKWVWNECLRIANDYDLVNEAEKFLKKADPAGLDFSHLINCPIWEFHWDKDKSGKWQPTRPFSRIALDRKEYILCCPITRSYVKPQVKSLTAIGLAYHFAKKLHQDKPWFCDVPSEFIRGEVKSFGDSWQAYKKGVRKKPRFKRRTDTIDTLISVDAKGTVISGNYIKITLLGWFNVKTLSDRWHLGTPVSVLKICCRASGWYLQLTGAIESKIEPPSDRSCGLDIGFEYIFADEVGKTIHPPEYYRKEEQKLQKLQRKLSRQKLMNDNKETNSAKRTRKQLAKQHEKIANQRRNFNHKISSYTVRTFGSIAMEDFKLTDLITTNRMGDPEHKVKRVVTNRNKSMCDAGLGQLRDMIRTKAQSNNRDFVSVSAEYTSQDCPKCGQRVKKSLSVRTHKCTNCGYNEKRKVAAAINIAKRAGFKIPDLSSGI
jgi:putative transposase